MIAAIMEVRFCVGFFSKVVVPDAYVHLVLCTGGEGKELEIELEEASWRKLAAGS